jgi:KTSC domain
VSATTMVPVASSHIKAVGYDEATSSMAVEFHNGSTYRYEKVPAEIHVGLITAESPGRYFAANVRGKFGHKPEPKSDE